MGLLWRFCCAQAVLIAVSAVGLGIFLQANGPLAQGLAAIVQSAVDCAGPSPDCTGALLPRMAHFVYDEVALGSYWGPTAEATAEKHLGAASSGLAGKIAIVTGSSSGLGVETARVLMLHGCHVIFAVRTVAKGEKVLQGLQASLGVAGEGTVMRLDTSDLDSVRAFAQAFLATGLPLHFLVANAGIVGPAKFETSKQGYELAFATNHLGHFLLGQLLEAKLLQSGSPGSPARMVLLSSEAATIFGAFPKGTAAENMPGQIPPRRSEFYEPTVAYGRTKFLNAAHAREQQRRWGPQGRAIAVAAHPGLVATEIFTKSGHVGHDRVLLGPELFFAQKNLSQGAATTIHCLLSPEVVVEARSGHSFYMNNAVFYRSKDVEATHLDVAEAVWEATQALLEEETKK